jgi:putative protein kinase ArgK-like GTPase of G3E family
MILPENNTIITIAEGLSGIVGFLAAIAKVIKETKKAKKEEANRIIEECKELDLVVKDKLEAKISVLENKIHALESDVAKDFDNLKETHAIELKNLSERIELLRLDLNTQHSQIIGLLTKLIN